jgi:peptidoglycan/xylan/chitin deacetylase (PgdA/CDA1 family)
MLRYKTIRIAFYVAVMLILAARWLGGMDVIYLLPVILIIYLCFISWGAYFICSDFFIKAFCHSATAGKQVVITFDDGPVKNVTPAVLDLLKKYNVTATFFCIGRKISGNEDILRRMAEEGHTIGNHSWSHSYFFDFFRDGKVASELLMTNETLKSITGREVLYFRPPFGVTNPVIARVADKMKLPVIGWSIRSLDTTISNSDQLFQRVTRRLKPGDVVLFHDSIPRMLPVLERFLEFTRQNGYEVIPLQRMIDP